MFFLEVSLLDLYLFSFFSVLCITFLIWNVTFLLGESNSKFYHKAFNAGFSANQYTQNINTNIRFFIVGLLFLIFDVELVLLLPIALSPTKSFLDLSSFYMFFLILTLLMLVETSKDFLSLI